MRKLDSLVTALGVCCTLAAQTQPSVPLRSESRLVILDAVVTDKKGASIRGLTAKDFHIFEDGKEQPVAGFSSETGPATPGISRQRYLVLLFDDNALGMDGQMWVRQSALKFIAANAGPNRFMAVIGLQGPFFPLGHGREGGIFDYRTPRVIQNFTADAGRLMEVVRRPRPVMSEGVGEEYLPPPLLWLLAKDLLDVPGRKAVAYFGGPSLEVDSVGVPQIRPFGSPPYDGTRSALVNWFRRANTAVYPILPLGCTSPASWLDRLATGTGGRSLCRGNDVVLALNEIVREQDESYSLGYVPGSSPVGSCHELRVTVDRADAKVRTREMYCNTPPVNLAAMNPLEKELENLAASSVAASSGASVAAPFFFVAKDVARVNVALKIPSPTFSTRKQRGKLHADLDVLGVAYTMAGGVAARFSDKVGYDFDSERELDAFRQRPLHYENQFDVASGNYNFKVVYRSAKDSFGKVEAALAVDPYDPGRLSVSAIALSREVRPMAASDSIDAALDESRKPLVFRGNQIVVSATDRLARSGLVEAYLEVYEPLLRGKTPVQLGLRVRLLNAETRDQEWDSGNVDLSGLAQPGNAVVPVALRLPVAALAPGAYRAEFTVEDSAGGRAMRDAEFRLE